MRPKPKKSDTTLSFLNLPPDKTEEIIMDSRELATEIILFSSKRVTNDIMGDHILSNSLQKACSFYCATILQRYPKEKREKIKTVFLQTIKKNMNLYEKKIEEVRKDQKIVPQNAPEHDISIA